jgi:phosphoglycolate phosphatase
MKYKHIIWDWNGTLLNDTSLCTQILNESLRKRDIPEITVQQYKQKFLFPIKTFYESIGFDFDKEPFENSNNEFNAGFVDQFKSLALQPFAKDTIIKFSEKKITQTILSASRQDRLKEQVNFFDITQYLQHVVGTNNLYAHGKEYEGEKLLLTLDIPAEETIIIGDTLLDSSVAKYLKIDCALVSNGHNDIKRLKETGAFTFSDIKEFYNWIITT